MWDQNDRPKAHFLSATNDLTGRRHHRWWLILWQKLKITKHVITSHSHNIDITIFPCHKIYLYIYMCICLHPCFPDPSNFRLSYRRFLQGLAPVPIFFSSTCEKAMIYAMMWGSYIGPWVFESRIYSKECFYWILLDSIRYQWKN